MDYISPLTIGLIGSMHCIGMCGPIVVALPLKKHNYISKISGTVIYNFGRVVTYSIIGVLFGLLGRGIHLAGFQKWTSIVLGIIMVLSVLFPFILREKIKIPQYINRITAQLINKLRKLFNDRSYNSLLLIGLLNGLLPCGLVYVAVAGAINSGNVVSGAVFMALFGFGTIPLLIVTSLASDFIGQKIRARMQKVVPYFVFLLGVIFILRGMSLGIPFISPADSKLEIREKVENGACCE